MDTDALTAKYRQLTDGDPNWAKVGTVVGVVACNHMPDMFTVGPAHVALANAEYGGQITSEVLQQVPCAQCKRPQSAHTYDRALIVQLTGESPKAVNDDVRAALTTINNEMLADGLTGVAFVGPPLEEPNTEDRVDAKEESAGPSTE